ncbi:hypothetical protein INR49_014200 [Caranx melampygus]|nr:hypothetical protein INR49_014200 [Caranx melampygus]
MLEQNQEVKKPAQFMLQRVEKESWQADKSGGKSGEKKKEEEKRQESGLWRAAGAERRQERLWAGREEVWSTGEEFKVPLFWRSGVRES